MSIIVGTPQHDGSVVSDTVVSSTAAALAAGALNTVFMHKFSVTITGVVDTAGNTYFRAGGGIREDAWYAYNCLPHASNVVTATFSAALAFRAIVVIPASGVDTLSDPLLDFDSGSGSSASPATPTLTAPAGSLIVGMMNSDSGGTTAANGFTAAPFSITGDPKEYFGYAYKISAGDAPWAVTCISDAWWCAAVSFRAAGVAGRARVVSQAVKRAAYY